MKMSQNKYRSDTNIGTDVYKKINVIKIFFVNHATKWWEPSILVFVQF